jgi:hypothetical protein
VSLVHAAPKVDQAMLSLLRRIAAELGSDGTRALNSRRLGRVVAGRVCLEEVSAAELADFLNDLGRHTRSGAATELLERSVADPTALTVLATMMHRWRMTLFADAVDLRRLEPAVAVGLYRAAGQAQVPAAALAELAAHLPPAAAAAVLAELPAVQRLCGPLCERLLARHPGHCVALIERLLTTPDGAARVGEVLLRTGAEGFGERVRNVALHGLVREGLGERCVLALSLSRSASIDARLAALAALEVEPALLARAIKRRPSDASEPLELRERLEALRGGWQA